MTDQARRARILESIKHLAARWRDGDTNLLREVFPLLAEGRPVSVERIADRTGASARTVEVALAHGRAGRDRAGRVVELSGLTLSPSLHRLEVDGVVLYSCCALLAHLTPLLLQRAVRLESVDPHGRGLIRIEFTPGAVPAPDPKEAVGTFVTTDLESVIANVGGNFCSHVHHFTGRNTAASYVAADPRRYLVDIGELRAAAVELYRVAWS